MNNNPFLISAPVGAEWLIVLAHLTILGLVAGVIVWRMLRAYKESGPWKK